MPIYDYVCSACHQVTEVIHGINADGPRFCPACGAEGTLRKGFTTPAIHFKGTGWAKKDRASSTTRTSTNRAGADAKPGSEGASVDSGGGDGSSTAGSTGGASDGASGAVSSASPSGDGSSSAKQKSGRKAASSTGGDGGAA
jgi:putative FmdB family regulatory protein